MVDGLRLEIFGQRNQDIVTQQLRAMEKIGLQTRHKTGSKDHRLSAVADDGL